MSKAIVTESKLTAIANAIRAKTGKQGELTLDEMATDIANISSFPSGLQKCEYIQNSSTSHFATNVIPQSGDVLTVDFQLTSVSGNFVYVGCANAESGATNRFLIGNQPSNEGYHYQGADKSWVNTDVVADTDRHTIIFDSSGTIKLDGETIKTFTPNWGNLNYPLGVFSKYWGSWSTSSYYHLQGKIYRVTLLRNESPVLDLIPCYIKPNEDIGMYDLVKGLFFINQGGGSFTKGADV